MSAMRRGAWRTLLRWYWQHAKATTGQLGFLQRRSWLAGHLLTGASLGVLLGALIGLVTGSGIPGALRKGFGIGGAAGAALFIVSIAVSVGARLWNHRKLGN